MEGGGFKPWDPLDALSLGWSLSKPQHPESGGSAVVGASRPACGTDPARWAMGD